MVSVVEGVPETCQAWIVRGLVSLIKLPQSFVGILEQGYVQTVLDSEGFH